MFEKNTSDLHSHLNGSFSLKFLEITAKKNNCSEVFERYKQLRQEYLDLTKEQPKEGHEQKLIDMVWALFGLIHKIIKNVDDIKQGTIDVVRNSGVRYREIRTTPKAMDGETRDDYIDAFEAGLDPANFKNDKKLAYGLLSLDRTIHTVHDAGHFIERVLKSPQKVLAGIDISGNPLGNRTLAGKDLANVVLMALEKGVGVAIHMGESDTDIEKQDTDAILDALEQWKRDHPDSGSTLFEGKIRLGHCIYLTQQQGERIRALDLCIEVCPTCHEKLNWHLKEKSHPVTPVYSDVSENLCVGSDDDGIFDGRMKNEFNQFMHFFSNRENLSRKEIKEHQSRFRFGG